MEDKNESLRYLGQKLSNIKICVIGLGYVGLPLATLFAKKYPVVGYDINFQRIVELNRGYDKTLEVETNELKSVLLEDIPINDNGLRCTSNLGDTSHCNFYIVTVPTPVNKHKKPDLSYLIEASKLVGTVINRGDIVVYESTVFPRATEDYCVPVIEKESGLIFNKNFFVGYSPERVNPSDKIHTIDKIKKVTSGSTPEVADLIDDVYSSVITAGTFKASSIKVAEASKVIENTQRDINIAFMNEIAKIFNKLDINTNDVIEAASTKWNFLPFKQGLVGGHCIGIDPYYLADKANEINTSADLILTARKINDKMGKYVADEVIDLMLDHKIKISYSNVLILGFTFKENCTDFRNTKVVDIYKRLSKFDMFIDIYDPWANPADVKREYDIKLIDKFEKKYDAIILAVAHDKFRDIDIDDIKSSSNTVVYDVKGFYTAFDAYQL